MTATGKTGIVEIFEGGKIGFTEEGGLAIRLTNKTGGASVQGYLVTPSAGTDDAFDLTPVDGPDVLGIVYEAGVADGAECWVVIQGICDVYFQGNTTRGHFARMTVAADDGDAAGVAISEVVPASPFSTDKHFQEVGHVIESRVGAGLARCVIHFN